ncbi:hypothetical protein R6Z07M_009159 [Ovis aries]
MFCLLSPPRSHQPGDCGVEPPARRMSCWRRGFLSLGLKTLGGARRQRYRHSPGYLLLVTLLKLQGGMSVAHTAGHLLLTLLLTEAGKTLGNAHSLCLDLTIKSQSKSGQPWCQVQGSVDTKPFLQYDSDSNKVKPLGFLGKEVNDTNVWTELSQTLAEAGKELRMVLPVIKLDKKETRDAHSLSYNFTVNLQPGCRQLWCEVQGQLDGEVFLSYDCGHAKIIFTSLLGEEVKTIKAWEIQVETLRDIRDWIKDQLHDFTLEKRMARDPLTLQARMACHCEDDRHISGSWQFGLNGLMSLHFDSENGHWRVDHPGGGWMKEKWESDRAVTDFLKKVSMETVGPGCRLSWCAGRKC